MIIEQNPLVKLLKEFTAPSNTFNPKKYSSGNWSGIYNGVEFNLRKNYCCGSGYVEGLVGDKKISIFCPHNQMIQVYLDRKEKVSFNINPHSMHSGGDFPDLENLFQK